MQTGLRTAWLAGASALVLAFCLVSPAARSQEPGSGSAASTIPTDHASPWMAAAVTDQGAQPTAAGGNADTNPTASIPPVDSPVAPSDAASAEPIEPQTPAPTAVGATAVPASGAPAIATPASEAAPTPAAVGPTPDGAQIPTAAAPASDATPVPVALPPANELLKDALEHRPPVDGRRSRSAELRKERLATDAFYAGRDFAPLWSVDGRPTAAAGFAIARLKHADDDGLDLEQVPVLPGAASSDADRATFDVALSDAVVTYAREASGSRIDPRTIAASIGDRPTLPDPTDVLTRVAAADNDAGNLLESFNPPQEGYKALRTKLAELRQAHAPVARTPIPAGPDLRVGMRDPRVPLIRARFKFDGQPTGAPEDILYDTRVAAAVADFQKTKGLPVSGILTARTVASLSGGQPSRLENEILANMERWRWMPRDMGDNRVEVNVPDFSVSVIRDGQEVFHNKVVVGKKDTPTPIFSNAIQFLIVNPYWNVPQSIIKKEMLPRLAEDPDYLKRLGYEVFNKGGRTIVRQPPGERNALGRIKFMFPNDYAVYLHDTPSRNLFGARRRAFSHGCVRVDQPFDFAAAVLGPKSSWSEKRVKGLMGGKERYVYLPKPLPIYIEYFTASVDPTGRLQLRDDIYGYSHKVEAALGLRS